MDAEVANESPARGESEAAILSALNLPPTAGAGFPALVGWAADAWGLAAGLGLYVAVPTAMLALTLRLSRGRS